MSDVTRIRVATQRPYDVVIGAGLLGELPAVLGDGVRQVAVIHPPTLTTTADTVRTALLGQGFAACFLEVPDGEQAKHVDVAAWCWSALGRAGFTRADAVVSLGGGATTDLAGFVAATWLRGVRVVHLPTTVLGMVDAAVGGKTGINTEHGKNLVGAFHEPAGVLCDLTALDSLPRAEVVSGLAEVVKCGFVADPGILDLVEHTGEDVVVPASAAFRELLERSVRVKAAVVADDLTESTSAGHSVGREVLNYGHTFGHAVERVERYAWRHGHAVAVGMVFVAELARLAGRLDERTADRHRTVLSGLGLPTTYRDGRWEQLHQAMLVDKKARADRLRFVVLHGLAAPAILEAPDPALLTAAYGEVCR
ncbi:MAG: 3-dehydroquinate synthase [Actinomycetota bacterium]|nr:3-dehydroquinate synthase [Actinomycetota bacterium]